MHKKLVPGCAAILIYSLASACLSPAGETEKSPKHLQDARQLLDGMTTKNSSYRHKEAEVRWKGEHGAKENVCHTDCSGFIDALLEHSYGYTEADFKKWLGSRRPTARRYYEEIDKENGFKKIAHVKELKPGDFIAIKYPAGDKNTGHIMLAASAVKALAPTKPLVAGTEQWEVAVIDCSMSAHGRGDTRRTEEGKSHPGVGRGVLRLYAHKSGIVAGYTWSTFANSEYFDQQVHPLHMGRLAPEFKP